MSRVFILCAVLMNWYASWSQITLDNVASISITDQVNWNYEYVQTYDFEIRFQDSIELWYTKQISQAEYEHTINKSQIDSLQRAVLEKKQLGRDSFQYYMKEFYAWKKAAYQHYCDTVSGELLQTLSPKLIQNLLKALQEPSIPREAFNEATLEPGGDYPFGIIMTSYYPLIGMTVVSNKEDTIVVYCKSQGDLTLPWTLKDHETTTFNANINWALHAILPDEKNVNKKRLIQGLPK